MSKTPAVYSYDKLLYLNQQHLKLRFHYFDQLEMKRCLLSFRKLLIDTLPADLHPAVKRYPEPRLRKLMDLLKERLKLPTDLKHHAYFFSPPELAPQELLKPLSKEHGATAERALTLLSTLEAHLSKLDEFTSGALNKAVSQVLVAGGGRGSTQHRWTNEEVFGMLRLVMTGERSPHGGAPRVGEVAEIVGKEETLKRVTEARDEVENRSV